MDHGLDVLAGFRHGIEVGDRGCDGFLAGTGGDRRRVEQAQRPARPGQPRAQDAPRRPVTRMTGMPVTVAHGAWLARPLQARPARTGRLLAARNG